jgi:hypothetical protein
MKRKRALRKRYGRAAHGPSMLRAASYVAHHPGVAILPVAEHVGPHGSRKFGYNAVHRAIKAGLILAAKMPNGTYRLYPNK